MSADSSAAATGPITVCKDVLNIIDKFSRENTFRIKTFEDSDDFHLRIGSNIKIKLIKIICSKTKNREDFDFVLKYQKDFFYKRIKSSDVPFENSYNFRHVNIDINEDWAGPNLRMNKDGKFSIKDHDNSSMTIYLPDFIHPFIYEYLFCGELPSDERIRELYPNGEYLGRIEKGMEK